MSSNWSFETRQIHAGQAPDPTTKARALPIYQTTSYAFDSSEHGRKLFALEELGNIYTRIMNPTQAVVEDRIASLEGGVGALLVASGQSAETLAILTIAAGRRSHRVLAAALRRHLQPVPLHAAQARHHASASSRTRTTRIPGARRSSRTPRRLYGESISNPQLDVLDFEAVAAVAHEAGVPLIVDNTVPTPYLIRPFEHGVDIVVHSATKYLGGHGTAIGGVIVDSGNFDWVANAERFPGFNTPDPSYNNLTWGVDLGPDGLFKTNVAFIFKARLQGLRDIGPAISPFNAFLISQGIETLSLRLERHNSNALRVAEWLSERDEVESVSYPGLESSTWHDRQLKYAPQGRRPDRRPSRSRAGCRPVRRSPMRWNCSPTWRTSVTCGRWSSTRRRPRTPSWPPPSS